MRYLLRFVCICALAVVPVGCGDEGKCEHLWDCDDGNQCTYDTCVDGRCSFSNKPDGTRCTRECLMGSGECENGNCDRCVMTCSLVHRDDAPGIWLLAVLGLLGIRLAARRRRFQNPERKPSMCDAGAFEVQP
jgi:hypothetical protein